MKVTGCPVPRRSRKPTKRTESDRADPHPSRDFRSRADVEPGVVHVMGLRLEAEVDLRNVTVDHPTCDNRACRVRRPETGRRRYGGNPSSSRVWIPRVFFPEARDPVGVSTSAWTGVSRHDSMSTGRGSRPTTVLSSTRPTPSLRTPFTVRGEVPFILPKTYPPTVRSIPIVSLSLGCPLYIPPPFLCLSFSLPSLSISTSSPLPLSLRSVPLLSSSFPSSSLSLLSRSAQLKFFDRVH